MAGGGEKTEKATPKRRQEARKKGQVAKSPDLNGAVVLLVSLFALSIWGPHIWEQLGASMRSTLAMIAQPQALTAGGIGRLFIEKGRTAGPALAPLAIGCLLSRGVGNGRQGEREPSLHGPKPPFKRGDPPQG